MCCFPKRKGKKKKCSDLTTKPLSLKTAYSSTTNLADQTTTGGGRKNRLKTGTRSAEKTSRPKVGDVHKKILTIEENQKVSEKQMVEAMHLLGRTNVNTTIIQRLEKANKEIGEKSQYSTRQGDIQFTIAKGNNLRKPAKDDDTLCPLLNKPDSNDAGQNQGGGEDIENELLKEEDWDEEPNSENWMWNTREIRYTCVDMIRHLDKNVLLEATGEPAGDVDQQIDWDPFAPIHVLENRAIFDCHTLRKNTFLTVALSSSNKAEQKAAKATPKTNSVPKKVKVNEQARILTKIQHDKSIRKTYPIISNSLESAVTQETGGESIRKSKTFRK